MAFTHTVLFSGNLLAKVCSPLQYDCRRWTGLSSGVICVRISAKLAPALHPNLKPPNRQTNLREIIDSGLQGPQDRRVRRWRHRLPPGATNLLGCSAAQAVPEATSPERSHDRANSGSRNNGANMYTKLSAHTSKAAKYDDFWASSCPYTI